MLRKPVLLLFACLLASFYSFGQLHSGKWYNTNAGIADNYVNYIYQDHLGNIWISTSAGLSRFDGKHWKSFYTSDGLKENFNVYILEDPKHRMWFFGIENKFTYLDQGEFCSPNFKWPKDFNKNKEAIHYQFSDSNSLQLVYDVAPYVLEGNLGDSLIAQRPYFTDSLKLSLGNETIKIQYNKNYLKWKTNSTKWQFTCFEGKIFQKSNFHIVKVDSGEFAIHYKGVLYFIKDQKVTSSILTDINAVRLKYFDNLFLISNIDGPVAVFENGPDGLFLSSTTMEDNLCTGPFIDQENGIWHGNIDYGIKHIPTSKIHTLNKTNGWNGEAVYNYYCDNDSVLISNSNWYRPQFIELNPISKVQDLDGSFPRGIAEIFKDSLLEGYVYKMRKNKYIQIYKGTPKEINAQRYNTVGKINHTSIIAERNCIYLLDTLGNQDTILIQPTISRVKLYAGKLWGTIENKMFSIDTKNWEKDSIKVPELKAKISGIEIINNKLWIGTRGNGLVIYDQLKPHKLNENSFLGSNIISDIVEGPNNCALITTNRGVCKIISSKGNHSFYRIIPINENSGLPSEDIEGIGYCNTNLWAATEKGISYFPANIFEDDSIAPNIVINKITVNDSLINHLKPAIALEHYWNDFDISYGAIRFRNRDKVKYRFRFHADEKWTYTFDDKILIHDLKPGNYSFEVQAGMQNVYWSKKSAIYSFKILPPYWETWWFRSLILAFIVISISVLIIWRFNVLKQTFQLNKTLDKVKQQMLNAQMNPHFLFNSLSSVQRYILENDTENGQLYLEKFSRLIRNVFEHSQEERISLDDELEAILTYMDLEKIRMNGRFDYKLEIDTSVNSTAILIPPLLIQPFLENSILHGLQSVQKDGLITIAIKKDKAKLRISITDNGIGRSKSKKIKLQKGSEHNSKGLTLTEQRLNLMRKLYKTEINFKIHDIQDPNTGEIKGTKVELTFEVNELILQHG